MKTPDKATERRKLIVVFNKFIRLRDQYKNCISCGIRPVQHAGHFWPTSQYPQPSMRFNEDNVHGQCIFCNTFCEGNRQGYREGLLNRYGELVFSKLDIIRSMKQTTWTVFEFQAMIKFYQKKCKELEKKQ